MVESVGRNMPNEPPGHAQAGRNAVSMNSRQQTIDDSQGQAQAQAVHLPPSQGVPLLASLGG